MQRNTCYCELIFCLFQQLLNLWQWVEQQISAQQEIIATNINQLRFEHEATAAVEIPAVLICKNYGKQMKVISLLCQTVHLCFLIISELENTALLLSWPDTVLKKRYFHYMQLIVG